MKHIFFIYHPVVIFAYIAAAIVCAMLTLNPVFVALSFLAGSAYAMYLNGAARYVSSLRFLVVLFLVVAVANPLTNHRGFTVLFTLGHTPFTLEALAYGLCAGGMLASVFLWFQCWQTLMTSERFLFLFGRALPQTALTVSMVLKWIPVTMHKMRCIRTAQTALGHGTQNGPTKGRLAANIRMVGILMSWSMEDSIDTADAMCARGYGAARRSQYSAYRMAAHDVVSLAAILALAAASIGMLLYAAGRLSFYPEIEHVLFPFWCYLPYAALLLYPLLLEGVERLRWLKLK